MIRHLKVAENLASKNLQSNVDDRMKENNEKSFWNAASYNNREKLSEQHNRCDLTFKNSKINKFMKRKSNPKPSA